MSPNAASDDDIEAEPLVPGTPLAIKPEDEVTGAEARRRQAMLAVLVVGYVATSVVASVTSKLNANAYGTRLVFFKSQIIEIGWASYMTAIVLFKVVSRPADLTDAMRRYPKRLIFAMGFLDSFADFLANVGSVNTPGAWQVLLGQLIVPFTMLFSFIILRARFRSFENAGAVTIIVGSVLAIMPAFTGRGDSGGGHTRVYSVLLYMAAVAPSAASNVLKEQAFKKVAFDIFFLSFMVTSLQIVLGWMFVPLLSLRGFGGIPLHEVPGTMRDGFQCLLGNEHIPVFEYDKVIGYCSAYVPRVTFLDSMSDLASGIFQLLLVKYGSAVLYVLAAALALPLSNLAFSWPALMGDSVERFSWYDIGGLLVVLLGFSLYRSRQFAILCCPKYVSGSDVANAHRQKLLSRAGESGDDDFGGFAH
eukprot:TRINITY_DN66122_c14_g1_i1.p1 TRINITY_DN66122_c14_g1~~TRINITY_DN66122_c14_g1_i1.p1  ORF type:complete len:426 (+),score=197.62 TRINITY_DN66122_c14_g1_i1:24-1280(+)